MKNAYRIIFILGGLLGAAGVILGAVGAHSLKGSVDQQVYEGFLTGTRYHMIHVLYLLLLGSARLS